MSRRAARAALAGATALSLALAPTAAIANESQPDQMLPGNLRCHQTFTVVGICTPAGFVQRNSTACPSFHV